MTTPLSVPSPLDHVLPLPSLLIPCVLDQVRGLARCASKLPTLVRAAPSARGDSTPAIPRVVGLAESITYPIRIWRSGPSRPEFYSVPCPSLHSFGFLTDPTGRRHCTQRARASFRAAPARLGKVPTSQLARVNFAKSAVPDRLAALARLSYQPSHARRFS